MNAETLIDRRAGLLVDVDRLPVPAGLPAGWVSYGAMVGRSDRFAPWRADSYGFGASLGNETQARWAAIGEAVERYCGNAVPEPDDLISHEHLTSQGDGAINPDTLALYSQRQYQLPGFPFVPFTRDLPVAWTQGHDLTTGRPTWVPSSLAYLDYFHGTRAAHPATHSLMYSGIATGPTRRRAKQAALEELIERDATTIWWANHTPATGVADEGTITGLLGRPSGKPLEVHLSLIPNQFDLPVIAALVEDRGSGLIGFGTACRARPEHAATKALVEALGLLRLARDLDEPTSPVWAAVEHGQVESHVYLPHRADRRYLEYAGERYRRLSDLPPVAQLYLDPRMNRDRLDRLRPAPHLPLTRLAGLGPGDPVDVYLHRLRAAGSQVISVDLTTPDVAQAGLHVVRVIATGLLGNGPPAFPLRGGTRLYDVPHDLGWVENRLTEDQLCDQPIPLA